MPPNGMNRPQGERHRKELKQKALLSNKTDFKNSKVAALQLSKTDTSKQSNTFTLFLNSLFKKVMHLHHLSQLLMRI